MRKTLSAVTLAAAVSVLCFQSAGAVAVDAAVLKQAVSINSSVQQVHFYYGPTRHHHVVKCYRELVIGPYVCHRVHHWWW